MPRKYHWRSRKKKQMLNRTRRVSMRTSVRHPVCRRFILALERSWDKRSCSQRYNTHFYKARPRSLKYVQLRIDETIYSGLDPTPWYSLLQAKMCFWSVAYVSFFFDEATSTVSPRALFRWFHCSFRIWLQSALTLHVDLFFFISLTEQVRVEMEADTAPRHHCNSPTLTSRREGGDADGFCRRFR
ncbi:unnamed protein product [Scytosiphon promiscuus]